MGISFDLLTFAVWLLFVPVDDPAVVLPIDLSPGELADLARSGGRVPQGDQHSLEAGIPRMSQEGLEFLIGHHPLPTVGLEEGELVEGVLRRDDLVLDAPVPAAFHGDHGMIDRLRLVRLGHGALGACGSDRLGLLEADGLVRGGMRTQVPLAIPLRNCWAS